MKKSEYEIIEIYPMDVFPQTTQEESRGISENVRGKRVFCS